MSLSEASFIAALVATGGIVAWIGDIVGYRLGKRRVSLFGIRPRTTAALVGICSGAAISIVTIAALSLTSEHVRKALFEMDKLGSQLDELKRRTAEQKDQIDEHKKDAVEAEQRSQEAQQREAAATSRVAALTADIQARQRQLVRLRADLAHVQQLQEKTAGQNQKLEQRASELEEAIRDSQSALEAAQTELRRHEVFLAYVSGGLVLADPIITAQEELVRAVIDTSQPTPDVRGAVAGLLEQASAYAAKRGARAGDNGRAVVYFVTMSVETGAERQVGQVPEPEALTDFVDILVDEPHKSQAVRVMARFSAWREQQVKVILDYRPNKLLFAKGEVAGSLVIDGSQPDVDVWRQVSALLVLRVRAEAKHRGMLTVPNENTFGSINIPELAADVDEIRTHKGRVKVEAVVAEDTWTVGPLELDLRLAGTGTDDRLGRSPDDSSRVGS